MPEPSELLQSIADTCRAADDALSRASEILRIYDEMIAASQERIASTRDLLRRLDRDERAWPDVGR